MIEAYIYLYHLDQKFDIPVTPESITNTVSVNFAQESILGRSAPQVTFAGSGPRTQSVNLHLHRQMMAIENRDEEAVDNLINGLLASTLPKYEDTYKAVVPPSILCRFGNETNIRGVVLGEVQVVSSEPWLKNGKMAIVDIQFQILEVKPYSAEYARQHGLLRGISTDLARSSVWKY